MFVVVIGLAQIIFPIVFFLFIIKIIFSSTKRTSIHKYFKSNVVKANNSDLTKSKYREYVDVSNAKLAKFNTDDLESLKDYIYDIFYKFEVAYNNLDYNVMKMLSTKQLYQNYYTGITLDLKVGKKRIIDSINSL